MKHPPLLDDFKDVLGRKHRVVVIAVGIFFLQFHTDGIDMGIFRRHFRRLLFQAPGFTLKDQFIVPLAQFSHTVDDLIAGVIVQPFRHSKIVLPGGQRLLAAAIKILFLPLQIIFDLHQAHSVCDKHQILGADLFLFAPAQHVVRDTLSGPLLKLQPGQSFCVSIHLPQAAEF